MNVKFTCAHCGHPLSATPSHGDSNPPCPNCGKPLALAASAPPPPLHATPNQRTYYGIVSLSLIGLCLPVALLLHEESYVLVCAISAAVMGHVALGLKTELKRDRKFSIGGVVLGYVVAGLTFLMSVSKAMDDSFSALTQTARNSEPRVEQLLAGEVQKALNGNMQKVFENIHPVGTAKSVAVHDVTVVSWKHGKDTNRYQDIQQFAVRYTVFWEGPITKDGFTKVTQTYDTEVDRYVSGQVLATNGTTNNDVGSALGDIGVKLLYQALTSE